MIPMLSRSAGVLALVLVAQNGFAVPTPTQGVKPLMQRQDANSAHTAFNQGLTALKAKQPEEARKAFQAALRADPKLVPAMLGLAELGFGARNDSEALKWLQQAERTAPKLAEVHVAMGRYYLSRKQPEKGEASLRKAVELDPKGIPQRLSLADALTARGADRDAIPLLKQVIQLDPKHPGAHFGLGQVQLRLGAKADAEQLLKKAAELEPKNPLPWLILAQGQSTAAAAAPYIDQALERQNDLYPALLLRAHWQAAENDSEGARQTLQRAAKADVKNAEPLVRMGLMEEQAGRRGEAKRHYLSAIERDPHHPIALNNLVMMGLAEKEDPVRLELMARRAVKALPDNPQVHDTLALVLRQRKDKTGALAAAERAVKLAPKDPALLLSLAEIQLWRGDRAAAKQSAQGVLALKAQGTEAEKARNLLASL